MRRNTINLVFAIFWLLLGTVLIGLNITGHGDEFLSGLGTGFVAVGAVQIYRRIRYIRDAEYRSKVDISNTDERLRFISLRAWAWTGYFYVLASAVCTIGFKLAGYDELSLFCSVSLCAVILFYLLMSAILNKKY